MRFKLILFCFLAIYTPFFAQKFTPKSAPTPRAVFTVSVDRDITVRDYFQYMDSLVHAFDTVLDYQLTEHLLVRANPFIIQAWENTDYYRQKERGVFVFDQQNAVVLKANDRLLIPTERYATDLMLKMARTRLEVNIPEYKLRIIEGNDTLHTFTVRVGQNTDKYLSEAGRERDLRTRAGKGQIVEVRMNSSIIEPTESKKVTTTLRDDGKRTKMPLQPWIETEINGERMGQLIHPTTNPKTLGAPYSNGCIGTREADIWRIYYYAPVGTPVLVRYDLDIKDDKGQTVKLKDIYQRELSHDLRDK
jgi:hypothetical protein